MATDLELEKNVVEEETFSDDALFNISSYGLDLSFREIINMYDEGDLEKPEMQRKYVWSKGEASRFIDSILLGLPVPSIFLAKTRDEKRLIVDGYQRIMTVYDYVKTGIFGGDGKPFNLSNSEIINVKWRGKQYAELGQDEQRKIRNASIHAIIFEQKHPQNDSGMYQIFERINTSGRPLRPQEIRNCVYHGSFNHLLMELNRNTDWRNILGTPEDSRMLDIELVLRCFAFSHFKEQPESAQKQINLVKYLNSYMSKFCNMSEEEQHRFTQEFTKTIEAINMWIGNTAFRNAKRTETGLEFSKKINPAIIDSLYVAVHNALQTGLSIDESTNLKAKYDILIQTSEYQDAISIRTTTVSQIQKRINTASSILFGVEYGW